ncbi:hypothetical protein HS7_15540 [Sulfolobales archaeon HS-7]|nr:hypothetical protein HS7_15540 [Sulfolobales archaeon HS-7]
MAYGKKRDRYELIGDILETIRPGVRKTRLMYQANLSFDLANKYIEELEMKGLIIKRADMFFLTERGKLVLDKLRKYNENKRSIDQITDSLEYELK